jgi:hypothetical protein
MLLLHVKLSIVWDGECECDCDCDCDDINLWARLCGMR